MRRVLFELHGGQKGPDDARDEETSGSDGAASAARLVGIHAKAPR